MSTANSNDTSNQTPGPTRVTSTFGAGTRITGLLTVLRHLVVAETKMIVREPTAVVGGILFPTAILLGLAAVPALREPSPELDGMRFIDSWAPTALIFGMVLLGLLHLPNVVAAYREKGVLRRMSTTPVHPGMVLAAQLIVAFAAILVATVLLLLVSVLLLDIALPQQPWRFTAAFLVGTTTLMTLGLLVAAVSPTARTANAIAMTLYFALMFVGGLFLPRIFLPDVLVRLGEVIPPGIQLLLDTWTGAGSAANLPYAAQLAIMGGIAVGTAVVAARFFRWE